MNAAFDTNWENNIYQEGKQLNRWPYDAVVSFVFQHRPRDKRKEDTRILEVGCGAGNNLLFAAQEGFSVAGIDGSKSALRFAEQRFAEASLKSDLRVGDFTSLPFNDSSFDLVFDRSALACAGLSSGKSAVAEVRRVLSEGGMFLFNPYSREHTSASSGREGNDGLTLDISEGTLSGCGQLCFYDRHDVVAALGSGWEIRSLQHLRQEELLESPPTVHAEWRVVACKTSN